MSLYDDDDTVTDKTAASGWASGIKMMQNQLAFKKATITAPKRDMIKKRTDKLPPVIDLKSRKEEEENTPPYFLANNPDNSTRTVQRDTSDNEWKFINEYDPYWPNDYEKVVKEMRERRDREEDEKRRQDREEREKKRREREEMTAGAGFPRARELEEEEEERDRPRRNNRASGAAIAPPPSLDDTPPNVPMPQAPKSFGGVGGSVAAKIMAKYGFKEGQGLGKSQQGIVKALEVEKTSKRGGRIVTENDNSGNISPPPPPPYFMPPPPMVPPSVNKALQSAQDKQESSISDILKKPSKVLILLNMVGPGEVDDELEPEVREECSSKYGNVTQVIIFEIPKAHPEEAVRIFVEFQRVEAAIKAVIDLNGRFFGGRQVRAGFYDNEDFKAYKLNETIHF
ncbi:Splicing factor 45 [Armadillidium nasatum]|uniref:Splicing factor 45 n=1 Tax=Armadillidium nasatum TaxID=96803 RepID=A0A5N5TP32_9CRUS|nr:Splicing factor 45 [Armadillidium nasatum]